MIQQVERCDCRVRDEAKRGRDQRDRLARASKEDEQKHSYGGVRQEGDKVCEEPESKSTGDPRMLSAVATASPGTIKPLRTYPSAKPAMTMTRR